MSELKTLDLRGVEEWREYEFGKDRVVYRIVNPVEVQFRDGGSTHRIVDADGVAHCVPAVGVSGCVLRWKSISPDKPVKY
jgi:hypothetical protein